MCIGGKGLVIAASPDGILVSDRSQSENLKHLVDGIGRRPMYEERRWGEYKVIDSVEFPDGFCALTKQLTLRPGCAISYQKHSCRDEIWTFIDGEGEIVLDAAIPPVDKTQKTFMDHINLSTEEIADEIDAIVNGAKEDVLWPTSVCNWLKLQQPVGVFISPDIFFCSAIYRQV